MSQRREFRELVSPERARSVIDGLEIDPGTETVPIASAEGRALAERVDATVDVPGFDRASMDGYAVRAADTFGADERDPARLEVIGAVHAGEEPTVTVDAGTAAEISTGAVLPPGADAVVMVERTREHEGAVAVETGLAPGDNVMAAGADIGAGRRLLGVGRTLTTRDVAVLAATGREAIRVQRHPWVGIVSTGDELVRPGEPLDHARGQIYDVNSHTLAAAVRDAGGEPRIYPHVGDDYDRMESMLERASEECDLILSSGSTSASAVDVIYRVIEETGELLLHGVAIKPGKPTLVGIMGDAAYVGLPGYPVSALMVFRRLVADRIRAAAGRDLETSPTLAAEMLAEERFGEGRMRLLPVGVVRNNAGKALAYPVDKGSGATTSLADADGVVEVPAETDYVGAGEAVTVHLFSEHVRPPSVLAAGEDDPTFADALDRAAESRFLPVGSREGRRRFDRGIPDLVVRADDREPSDGTLVAEWQRSWGLLVPEGNPTGIDDLGDLVDANVRFANLEGTALRTALDDRLADLAAERDTDRDTLTTDIRRYGLARRGIESAARQVARGTADAGLGLRSHAETLDLAFRPLGEQTVRVYVASDRREKPAVVDLLDVLSD